MSFGYDLPVLFLDIDGVLNSRRWFDKRGGDPDSGRYEHAIDPAAVGLLNQLIVRVTCAVVLSSTWRMFGRLTVQNDLQKRGFIGRIADVTPRNLSRHDLGVDRVYRGHEIQEWLNAQSRKPSSFAIVDDDSDMVHLEPRLVQTTNEFGLTQDQVDILVDMLRTPYDWEQRT